MSDLYVKCPRCNGHRMVFAITSPGNEYFPSRGEYFDCPLCGAIGEADAKRAREWLTEQAENEDV